MSKNKMSKKAKREHGYYKGYCIYPLVQGFCVTTSTGEMIKGDGLETREQAQSFIDRNRDKANKLLKSAENAVINAFKQSRLNR